MRSTGVQNKTEIETLSFFVKNELLHFVETNKQTNKNNQQTQTLGSRIKRSRFWTFHIRLLSPEKRNIEL